MSILIGDLNTTPETEAIKFFQDSGYRDAYLERVQHDSCANETHTESESVDWCAVDGMTFNSNSAKLTKRIDFMLFRTAMECSNGDIVLSGIPCKNGTVISQVRGTVTRFGLVGHRTKAVEAASDHLGQIARLHFTVD